MENQNIPPKAEAVYRAVAKLFTQGADLNSLTVSEITAQAGIGKGTAYQYFANKEEMIAGAIIYNTREICDGLYEKMRQTESFRERIRILFDFVGGKAAESNCICHIIHTVTDNSVVGAKIKEMIKDKGKESFGIAELLRKIVSDENEHAKSSAEEQEYLVLEICSKMLCYAMLLEGGPEESAADPEAVKQMLCESVCREMQYFKRNG